MDEAREAVEKAKSADCLMSHEPMYLVSRSQGDGTGYDYCMGCGWVDVKRVRDEATALSPETHTAYCWSKQLWLKDSKCRCGEATAKRCCDNGFFGADHDCQKQEPDTECKCADGPHDVKAGVSTRGSLAERSHQLDGEQQPATYRCYNCGWEQTSRADQCLRCNASKRSHTCFCPDCPGYKPMEGE